MRYTSPFLVFMIFLLAPQSSPIQATDWVRTNPGGGGAFLASAAGPDGTIVVGSDLSGAYMSKDRGKTWSVIGPLNNMDQTHVSEVRFDPTAAGTIFLGTNEGIFRSTNGGDTFAHVLQRPIVPGETYLYAAAYVTEIRLAPSDSSVVYAAVHLKESFGSGAAPFDGYVYRSDDNGVNWTRINDSSLPITSDIVKLEVDPQNSAKLYALTGKVRSVDNVTGGSLYVSTNSGVNWAPFETSKEPIMDLAIDPTDADVVYLTRYDSPVDLEGSIFKSTDGGANFVTIRDGYSGVIWINRDDTSQVRLIDPRRAFPWWDKSGTWETLNAGSTWQRVPDPFTCPAGTPSGDMDSPICAWDEHWVGYVVAHPQTYGTAFSGYIGTFGEDLHDSDSIFWVTSQWVYNSDDGGAVFKNLHGHEPVPGSDWWRSRGVDNINMMDIAISPADPQRIYLGMFDMGCWRSLDGGKRWQSCNPPDPIPGTTNQYFGWPGGKGGNVASILADPSRANVVWTTMSVNQEGQSPTYLLRSTDSGQRNSWVQSNSGLPTTEVMGLSVDPTSAAGSRTLFVTAAGEVYRSTDDGASWTLRPSGCNGGCRATAVDRVNGDLGYAGGETGLFRSQDGGDTWAPIGLAEMQGRRNTDLTWVGFWEWRWYGIFDIETHPTVGGTVYVSSFGPDRGLHRSTDSGDTWDSSPGNDCPGASEPKILCDDFSRGVALSAADPNLIYATSSSVFTAGGNIQESRGVLRSSDAGQSWVEDNQGLPWPFAITVDVHPTDSSIVFVGSPGTGYARSACTDDADCDGQVDSLDCRSSDPTAGTPFTVVDLGFPAGSTAVLEWSTSLFADLYDVSRGEIAGLAGSNYGVCQNGLDPDRGDTTFSDAATPPAGSGFFYLVRGYNDSCQVSASWGQDSSGQVRSNANPGDCP